MKVLAVVCSHAGKRSNTAKLCGMIFEKLNTDVFGKSAEFECITLDTLQIGFCKSCNYCFRWGKCPQAEHDDINILREKILRCDLLMMASPVYMCSVSGSYKNLIDRLALWCHTLSLAGKLCIPVSTTGNNHLTSAADIISSDMRMFGCIVLPAVCAKTELGNPLLSDAAQMQETLVSCCKNVEAALNDCGSFIHDISRGCFRASKVRFEILSRRLKSVDLKPHGELEIWENSGFGSYESFDELCASLQERKTPC